MIDFRTLLKAGVHFGHQVTRWCPKMRQYIWGQKNGVSLIDISKTAAQLEKAEHFLKGIAEKGGVVLWVGTKKPAKKAIDEAAKQTEMPWVSHRWIGGTLSNFSQVKKSVTKLLHLEEALEKQDSEAFITKKELSVMRKTVERLQQNVGGIRNLAWPIHAVVVVDVKKEHSAVQEASRMGLPIVGIVDTNSDPSMVDYVIPSNDDAPQAIELLIGRLSAEVKAGAEVAKERKAQELKKRQEEAAAKAKESAEAAKKKAAAKKAPSESKKPVGKKAETRPNVAVARAVGPKKDKESKGNTAERVSKRAQGTKETKKAE